MYKTSAYTLVNVNIQRPARQKPHLLVY